MSFLASATSAAAIGPAGGMRLDARGAPQGLQVVLGVVPAPGSDHGVRQLEEHLGRHRRVCSRGQDPVPGLERPPGLTRQRPDGQQHPVRFQRTRALRSNSQRFGRTERPLAQGPAGRFQPQLGSMRGRRPPPPGWPPVGRSHLRDPDGAASSVSQRLAQMACRSSGSSDDCTASTVSACRKRNPCRRCRSVGPGPPGGAGRRRPRAGTAARRPPRANRTAAPASPRSRRNSRGVSRQ